ncbi:MAG: class I SAM-dependent methyltransferase [Deltaproteobacteria bacterium]|nr:class I SAM-dependent methyltransferase [Deltaproteobacteria bacterium]
MNIKSVLQTLIPPLSINYNTAETNEAAYKEEFASDYLGNFLPRCLEVLDGQFLLGPVPRILDIGCGLGPMAFAYAALREAVRPLQSNVSNELGYVGIDIRTDAIAWLRQAYHQRPECLFHLHEAAKSADYVGNFGADRKNTATTWAQSDGTECDFRLPVSFTADLQWSSSFFTHLTPQAVEHALAFVASSLSPHGRAVNTWLIVDAHSCLALASGAADRQLPVDAGQYLTYSRENPLVCTAYKLPFIMEAHARAGLQIVSIERGHWRGGQTRNLFGHYQDVIVSRKI